jgi:plasmid stabilization system protein ParE
MIVRWSYQARHDADEIWNFIAADDPDAADRIIARFHEALRSVAEHPKLGRRGLARASRTFPVSDTPYILFYEVTKTTIEVRRVFHGARQWPRKWKRP